jgi:transcriptional regulator with PAS, ATPase and Fis domain
MQVVWYIIHLEMNLNTRLLQLIRSKESKSTKATLIEAKIEKSSFAGFLYSKEEQIQVKNIKRVKSSHLITSSISHIYNLAKEIALTNKTTVLIQGETGTGKEHLAKEIHNLSNRKSSPFIVVNCGAMSSDILESRLFGHEKGAFTGAVKSTDGFFKSANNGTIFLDEIGDINNQMQVSILRVIQEGDIQKVGGSVPEKVNVRIIAATNKNLYEECQKGLFRWDLYYRLCVAELTLPPLRYRGKDDIKLLIEHFKEKSYKILGYNRKPLNLTPETIKILCNYSWPGNIRELENLIERYYAFGLDKIRPEDLPNHIRTQESALNLKLESVIRNHIRKVVELNNGNLIKSKDSLGIGSVNTIKKYLK